MMNHPGPGTGLAAGQGLKRGLGNLIQPELGCKGADRSGEVSNSGLILYNQIWTVGRVDA